MKLLFVHEYLGAMGGAETNLFEVATALRQRGHEVALLHGRSTGRNEAEWHDLFPQRFAADAPAAARVALRDFKPTAVFMHNSPGLEVTAGLVHGGVPVVRMVHDHHMFCLRGCRYSAWSREPCTRALSPLCLFPCGGLVRRNSAGGWALALGDYLRKKQELEMHRGFARLIVASEYMHEELRRNGFKPEQIEIHAPVPAREAPEEAKPADPTRKRIVFAGQIVRGKGVDVLLEALSLVRTPFECVILGDGNHRAHCEELAQRLGLGHQVTFTGFVPGAEVAAHYQAANVAVFSSVWPEPFGLSGLEALRHGLPVVAFDVGGVREWLEDGVNGLLAPWMDRLGFARRVEALLNDPEHARRLGANGRALAAERFNFKRYVSGLEELLARVSIGSACEVNHE